MAIHAARQRGRDASRAPGRDDNRGFAKKTRLEGLQCAHTVVKYAIDLHLLQIRNKPASAACSGQIRNQPLLQIRIRVMIYILNLHLLHVVVKHAVCNLTLPVPV